MAKRKTRPTTAMPPEPSRTDRIKWASESLARTLIETDPTVERAMKALSQDILRLAKRPLIPQPGRKRR